MIYRVAIVSSAEKEFRGLPKAIQKRIEAKLLVLESNPRPSGCVKLRNTERYRIRLGDYRVIYSIRDSTREIVVISIGHRREIYR